MRCGCLVGVQVLSDTQTITPSIYRLDLEKVKYFLVDKKAKVNAGNAHEHVLAYHAKQREQGLSKAKSYKKKIGPLTIGQYQVVVCGTDSTGSRQHAWKNLFPEEIPGLDIRYPNLAAFVSTGDTCYTISAGQGQTLFEQFVDTAFPLEIAKHIMKPEMSATERREIAGAIYGQIQQYRTSQMIVSSQTLGTVWRTLKGEITEEVKKRSDFDAIFEPDKRSIGIVANSSLTIRKSVSVDKFVQLLEWLVKLQGEKLTPEQKEHFDFLNGLKEISSRKSKSLINDLEVELGNQLFTAINSDGVAEFDYSHRNFMGYQDAQRYCFTTKKLNDAGDWDNEPPSATQVLAAIKDAGEFDGCKDGGDVLGVIGKTTFVGEHEDITFSTHGSVLDHLHGEITYKDKKYFLVDGKWYIAQSAFIKRLAGDFKSLLASEHFTPDPALQLESYTSKFSKEGEYNEDYIGKDGWLVGDRVFVGNIEIADLIHFQKDKVYIIHNKLGFGVTVRDVCSQILLSMSIMNRIKSSSDKVLLGDYYERMIKHYYSSGEKPSLTKEQFIDRILKTSSKNISYIIGYVNDKPVAESTRSNIAKFESVKLCNTDRRAFDFELKIMHVPKK